MCLPNLRDDEISRRLSGVNVEPFRPEGVNLPNVMTPGAWIILGVIVTAILAGFTYMLVKYLRSRIPWKPLIGSSFRASYYGFNHDPDPIRINQCLNTAASFLVQYSTFGEAAILKALQGVKIYVQPTPAWMHAGEEVAGLTQENVIMIGSDYAALLHECAHVCEEAVTGGYSYDHAGWDQKGIRTAESEYDHWYKTSA